MAQWEGNPVADLEEARSSLIAKNLTYFNVLLSYYFSSIDNFT